MNLLKRRWEPWRRSVNTAERKIARPLIRLSIEMNVSVGYVQPVCPTWHSWTGTMATVSDTREAEESRVGSG